MCNAFIPAGTRAPGSIIVIRIGDWVIVDMLRWPLPIHHLDRMDCVRTCMSARLRIISMLLISRRRAHRNSTWHFGRTNSKWATWKLGSGERDIQLLLIYIFSI